MRTTLDIDDDVLAAAKERARAQGRTAGAVLSELARQGLLGAPRQQAPEVFLGFRLSPHSMTGSPRARSPAHGPTTWWSWAFDPDVRR